MNSIFLALSLLCYKLFLRLYVLGIRIAAYRNPKAKQWIEGRKNYFQKVIEALKLEEKRIWVHCASLGEFEQGRTLIEKIKRTHPEFKIVLTFFSPSGYEIRKNYPLADYVFYLPIDSRQNSRRFLELVQPQLAIFIKYEFWYYYFRAIEKKKVPLIIVSAIFRKNQSFFKWYGLMFRKMLFNVSHFFVQDHYSQKMLQKLDLGNSDICGDTRVDRVLSIAASAQKIPIIENFLQGRKAIIGGSIYTSEAKLIAEAIKEGMVKNKIILVPHNIDAHYIHELEALLDGKAAIFSRFKQEDVSKKVLIVDTVGMLSSIYQYGSLAVIGGGFGKSIHNILEPAAFSIPILFGPHFHKFKEAYDMIASGAAFCIRDYDGFIKMLNHLDDENELALSGNAALTYLHMNAGGTEKIYNWLSQKELL